MHRNATLKEFFQVQKEESSNILLSWIITSVVFCVMASVVLSQFIPIVPKFVSERSFLGLELNKFGFTLISIMSFYFIKSILTFIFYRSLGVNKLLINFYIVADKFYFFVSLLLIMASIAIFYFPIDEIKFLYIFIISSGILLILKNTLYLFNKAQILPKEWYYKILYICTLQIVPILVLWKFLF